MTRGYQEQERQSKNLFFTCIEGDRRFGRFISPLLLVALVANEMDISSVQGVGELEFSVKEEMIKVDVREAILREGSKEEFLVINGGIQEGRYSIFRFTKRSL